MAVPLVYGMLAFTIPESPRYLVATPHSGGPQVLSQLLGEKNVELTITDPGDGEAEEPPSWLGPAQAEGRALRIVWVGIGLSVFQQFVGINVIFYYTNVLWQAVGFNETRRSSSP